MKFPVEVKIDDFIEISTEVNAESDTHLIQQVAELIEQEIIRKYNK